MIDDTSCHAAQNRRNTMTTQMTMTPSTTGESAEGNSLVAVYGNHLEAESAVKDLQRTGFDMRKLSIVGRDFHTEENVVGYYNTGDRMKAWGSFGAFWGGLWGMLFGAAFFMIPGLGPILVAGPLVAWIVGALEGAAIVGGLSAIGAALVGLGMPRDSVLKYETELKAGKFLVLAHGTDQDVARAKELLQLTDHQGVMEHAASSSTDEFTHAVRD